MAKIPGLPVAMIAVGGVLVWSGVENEPVTTIFRSLAKGKPPAKGGAESFATAAASTTASTIPAGGGGTPAAPSGPGETAWITAFLLSLGAPPTKANLDSMASWIQHETPWPPDTPNNPMNTTLPEPGSHSVNSVNVQAYPTAAEGILANRDTLLSGYPQIVAALRSGRGLCGVAPQEFSKWSGGGYSGVC